MKATLFVGLFFLFSCQQAAEERIDNSVETTKEVGQSANDNSIKDNAEPTEINQVEDTTDLVIASINDIEWSETREVELDESTEGGVAHFFFQDDELKKILVTYYGETGKKVQEFYLIQDQLFYVKEANSTYNRPIYWDSLAMVESDDTEYFDPAKTEIMIDESYFQQGDLYKQLNNQDCGSPFAEEYLEKEENRLLEDLAELLRKLEE